MRLHISGACFGTSPIDLGVEPFGASSNLQASQFGAICTSSLKPTVAIRPHVPPKGLQEAGCWFRHGTCSFPSGSQP